MKKITLAFVALLSATFSMNAQADCASAQAISFAANTTKTVRVDSIAGNPATKCYGTTPILKTNWYSFTPTEKVHVVVEGPAFSGPASYFATFEVNKGTCDALECEATEYVNRGNETAKFGFVAEANTTYYILCHFLSPTAVVPNTNMAFDLKVTNSTTIPEVPVAAEINFPLNGATDVPISETYQSGNQTLNNVVVAKFNIPAEGLKGTKYTVLLGTFFNSSIDNDLRPVSVYFAQNDGAMTVDVPFKDMEEEKEYLWAVLPNRLGMTPDTSSVWGFKTEKKMSVEDVQEKAFVHYVANNMFTVEANEAIESVTIFNLLGQQVTSTKVNANEAQINIANLQAGVYIAQVTVNGKVQSVKFVK